MTKIATVIYRITESPTKGSNLLGGHSAIINERKPQAVYQSQRSPNSTMTGLQH